MDRKLVYVKAPPEVEAREKARLRAREAVRRYAEAEREVEQAMAILDREVGPDPRRAAATEAAIAEFCATVTGQPSIRPA